MNDEDTIASALAAFELGESAIRGLTRYLALIRRWNGKFNLTAIREPAEMIDLHVKDSLAIRGLLTADTVLDVGTGAGLPGMVLAIAEPERRFVLNDSNGKKTRFLVQVCAELGLENVEVIQARVEALDRRFAQVTCRAFAPLDRLARLLGGVVAPGGTVLAMKANLEEESMPAADAPLAVHTIHDLPPLRGARRCVVELRMAAT